MPIKFEQENIDIYITERERTLAGLSWKDYKESFPEKAKQIAETDEAGIDYMTIGVKKAKVYMKGFESDREFNKWLAGYLGLHFHIGENFDEHPFTHSILTEQLWHPFKRVDILMKMATVMVAEPSQKAFYHQLEKMV